MMKKRYKGAISYRTDIGRVRINNEDQAAAAINSQGEVLLCVCDGMGGQNKGDYASKMAIDYVIDTFKERSDDLTAIEASIITEKESHKGIIIGKGGSMLKKIGSDARRDIEEMTGTRVFLKLFVKVRKNWRDSESDLRDYGYDRKKL